MPFITAEIDSIVEIFRLRPPAPAVVNCFLVGLGLVVAGIIAGCLLQARRETRRRRAAVAREHSKRILEAGIAEPERRLLDLLSSWAAAPVERCATSVVDFDRGVDGLLGESLKEEERSDLILRIGALRRKLGLHAPLPGWPLASTRALPPNLPVQVTIREDLAGPSVGGAILSAREDALTIRLFGSPGIARSFHPPCEVEVFLIRALDAGYSFRAEVLAVRELDAAFLVLRHPAAIERIQKRGFARVEVREAIRFRRVPELRAHSAPIPASIDSGSHRGSLQLGAPLMAGKADPEREWNGTLVSISAGGIRLETPVPLARGECVRLILPFLPVPHGGEPCFARVVRSRGIGSCGLRFEGMPPALQAAIFQYVRAEEIRRIREEKEKLESAEDVKNVEKKVVLSR